MTCVDNLCWMTFSLCLFRYLMVYFDDNNEMRMNDNMIDQRWQHYFTKKKYTPVWCETRRQTVFGGLNRIITHSDHLTHLRLLLCILCPYFQVKEDPTIIPDWLTVSRWRLMYHNHYPYSRTLSAPLFIVLMVILRIWWSCSILNKINHNLLIININLRIIK